MHNRQLALLLPGFLPCQELLTMHLEHAADHSDNSIHHWQGVPDMAKRDMAGMLFDFEFQRSLLDT